MPRSAHFESSRLFLVNFNMSAHNSVARHKKDQIRKVRDVLFLLDLLDFWTVDTHV